MKWFYCWLWARRFPAALAVCLGLIFSSSLAYGLSEADRRLYASAFAAARLGDIATAANLAAKAQDQSLVKVVRWLTLTHDRAPVRFADIAHFLEENPDWPDQVALRQRAEELDGTASDGELADWFQHYPPVTPLGRVREAELWQKGGHQQEARALIRQTWVNGDFSSFEEGSLLQRFHETIGAGDHVKRLDRLVWDGDADAAQRMMLRVEPGYRALAKARLALQQGSRGAEKLLALVPAALRKDPGLLYDEMRWYRHKDQYAEALKILDHVTGDFDRPAVWGAERQALARVALSRGDQPLAYRLASQHGLSTGQTFGELEFLAGWIALRSLHQPERAYDHFVRLHDDATYPVSVARGAYWAGRAAEEMKSSALAKSWYKVAAQLPTTFYGQLAAAQLEPDLAGEAENRAGLASFEPSAAETSTFEKNELTRIARQLAELGAHEYVRPFVRKLLESAKSPGEQTLVARLALELDLTDLAVSAAKRASRAGIVLLSEGYPAPELPQKGQAEAPLVLAMARQESAFDRQAISRTGARGLMQLMPATARRVARSLQLPYSATRLTADGDYNFTLGRSYLDQLLDDFAGSYVLAIAAYNAGPNRVHQWTLDFGDPRKGTIDTVDWIESIPFTETRDYVQRVLENLQIYRLRLGDRRLAFSLASDLKR
ncbi:MAG TPA: lytic transglycosylase domain-containing protein [Stellaceae bacterium]|nr:lytic transglycosylase domain-containing protein [Stellaceae bacterium]